MWGKGTLIFLFHRKVLSSPVAVKKGSFCSWRRALSPLDLFDHRVKIVWLTKLTCEANSDGSPVREEEKLLSSYGAPSSLEPWAMQRMLLSPIWCPVPPLFQGENLDLAISKDEVMAMIGEGICVVKTLTRNHLYCEPPSEQPAPRHRTKREGTDLLPEFTVGNQQEIMLLVGARARR